ncbi:MAG: PEGA domain-containing protein, partial [Bacteroidales bacterium]
EAPAPHAQPLPDVVPSARAVTPPVPDVDVHQAPPRDDAMSDFPLHEAAPGAVAAQPHAMDRLPVIEEQEPSAPEQRFTDFLEDAEPEAVEPEPDDLHPFVAEAPVDGGDRIERPSVIAEPPVAGRSRLLPFAVVLVVGLIIGAIGGYVWGTRRQASPTPAAPASQAAEGQAPAGQAPAGQAGQATSSGIAQPTPSAAQPATKPAPGTAAPAATPGGAATTPPSSANRPAPKTAPPAAPAVNGRLTVRSTPSGATVTVNGRRRGVTPLNLSKLAAGRYTVRLTRGGYVAEERDVVISQDHPSSTLTLTLRRGAATEPAGRAEFVGSVSVDSSPPGAKVFLDGKLVGTTPCVVPSVPIGSHVVRVDLIGFRRWAQSVEVKAGARIRVTAALERESQ